MQTRLLIQMPPSVLFSGFALQNGILLLPVKTADQNTTQ